MHISVVEDLPTSHETSSSIPSTGTKRKGQSPLSSHTLFLLWIPASLGPLFHGSVKPHPLLLACVSQLDLICITPQLLVGVPISSRCGGGGTSLHVHSIHTIAIQLISAAKQSTRVAKQIKVRHWQHKPHHLSPGMLKIVNKSYFQLLCQE